MLRGNLPIMFEDWRNEILWTRMWDLRSCITLTQLLMYYFCANLVITTSLTWKPSDSMQILCKYCCWDDNIFSAVASVDMKVMKVTIFWHNSPPHLVINLTIKKSTFLRSWEKIWDNHNYNFNSTKELLIRFFVLCSTVQWFINLAPEAN